MENSNIKTNNISLMSLPDSYSAWIDGLPEIPQNIELHLSDKLNGDIYEEDFSVVNDYDTEIATDLEKLKINVIRSSVNKDLTYGEFKRLGTSNLGFVTGINKSNLGEKMIRSNFIKCDYKSDFKYLSEYREKMSDVSGGSKPLADELRKILWPKILRIKDNELIGEDDYLKTVDFQVPDDIYQQILKDVTRSGGHLPPDSTDKEMEKFHDELTKIICWVLHRHPNMNYYQGYNDVAATVLIVMGFEPGLKILEKISLEFLERFMEKTMERVNQELFYIFALLERVHPTLLEHLENVELFPHFALAEYTTWYAHKYAENRKLLHRLFDFFLGSPPLMPLYVSTVIVAHRAAEIFNTTPDMGHTHKVLCTLPNDLPIEELLLSATQLYRNYPPESIGKDVCEYDQKRRMKEQEWKMKAEISRKERERQRQLKIAVPHSRLSYHFKGYRTITVVTILAIGIYAFFKTGSGLN